MASSTVSLPTSSAASRFRGRDAHPDEVSCTRLTAETDIIIITTAFAQGKAPSVSDIELPQSGWPSELTIHHRIDRLTLR